MDANAPDRLSSQEKSPAGAPVFHRSAAVARMLRMPVATLRLWERRYHLSGAARSPGGQRLYGDADVRRLALIRRLNELGHAISRLAGLDLEQLQRVAATHSATLAATQSVGMAAVRQQSLLRPWRLAVIGRSLAIRLERPALSDRLVQPFELVGLFDDIRQAAERLSESDLDALLFHEPQLHPDWLAAINALAPAFADLPKAVLYGFASDAVCERVANAGVALLREPQPDAALAQWLNHLSGSAARSGPSGQSGQSGQAFQSGPSGLRPTNEVSAPRRWDDEALAGFAGLASKVACECPRHIAELLMQLSSFEVYSAECELRSAADAELHAYLKVIAADSRVRFEAALEHVALHEGLLLPVSASPGTSTKS
jgi:DNA-binding transcriptional MerR regulator